MISRREFLLAAGKLALAGAALPAVAPRCAMGVGPRPLREYAAERGLLYGSAASNDPLQDPEFAKLFVSQCAIVVPEGALKWRPLRPTQSSFNFRDSDWLLDFAQSHKLLVRGHTLVWHQSIPDWFETYVNATNAQAVLVEHIRTVVGRYSGKLHSWDVVNEVLEPNDERLDGLRKKPWLSLLGPDYIDLAFRTARAADPKALLVWNENLLDGDNSYSARKRTALLQWVTRLRKTGVPIDAIGVQGHLRGDEPIASAALAELVADIGQMGLKVLVTELDVRDPHLPADVSTRDKLVAATYKEFLSTVLQQKCVVAVLTWGLSDKYTWLSSYAPRADKLPVRPLPFDANLQPTPAFYAMASAFEHAPNR